jgi:hypothetical protein
MPRNDDIAAVRVDGSTDHSASANQAPQSHCTRR